MKTFVSRGNMTKVTTYQAIIGSVLINMRHRLQVEQVNIAKSVGVGQSTWSRIERGESTLSVTQLVKAAKELRVNPSIILSESEKVKRELEADGVQVLNDKIDKGNTASMVVGAALGALVTAAFMKNRE